MNLRPPIQQCLTTFPRYRSRDITPYLSSMWTLHIRRGLYFPLTAVLKDKLAHKHKHLPSLTLAAACVPFFRPAALLKWIMTRMNETGTFWKPRQNYHAEWLWRLSWLSSAWPIHSATIQEHSHAIWPSTVSGICVVDVRHNSVGIQVLSHLLLLLFHRSQDLKSDYWHRELEHEWHNSDH